MYSKFQDIVNAGTRVREFCDARTRIGNDIEKKDLFYYMMNTADPKTGNRFTSKDLWVESMLLMTAGKTRSIHVRGKLKLIPSTNSRSRYHRDRNERHILLSGSPAQITCPPAT